MLSLDFSYFLLDHFCSCQLSWLKCWATNGFSLLWFYIWLHFCILIIYVCYIYIPFLSRHARKKQRDSKKI